MDLSKAAVIASAAASIVSGHMWARSHPIQVGLVLVCDVICAKLAECSLARNSSANVPAFVRDLVSDVVAIEHGSCAMATPARATLFNDRTPSLLEEVLQEMTPSEVKIPKGV